MGRVVKYNPQLEEIFSISVLFCLSTLTNNNQRLSNITHDHEMSVTNFGKYRNGRNVIVNKLHNILKIFDRKMVHIRFAIGLESDVRHDSVCQRLHALVNVRQKLTRDS